MVNIPVCVALILFADRIAVLLKRSPKATRFVDWLFAGVLGAFAVKLILTQRSRPRHPASDTAIEAE